MSQDMRTKEVPEDCTAAERWIAHHRVHKIRVENRQTGTDTAETYVHLEDELSPSKVCWLASTFNKVARLDLSWATVAEAKYGVREKVKKREDYEKANANELAEYKRLKQKYEGETAP